MMRIFGPYKKRSRSASMQLSINAIVILVMAMAVLGLGLGLIRGVLGSGKDKLMGSLESMDLSEKATSDSPITNINNIELKRNKENQVAIGFYNKDSSNCAYGAEVNMTCSGGLNWSEPPQVLDVDVDQGESKKLGGIFKTEAPAKSYPCKIEVVCNTENSEGDKVDEPPNVVESASTFVKVTA
ncbi:MAG: hypothetical protein ACLFTH_02990 [Candidatus Woesearchaeota archaeon]